MAASLTVDVVVHAPTVFHHCQHCEVVWRETGFSRGVRADQMRSTLPEDLQREYEAVWDWVLRLLATYQDRVSVRVIDATSLAGVWRAARYRLHRYPAIVVDGRDTCAGTDTRVADELIARRMALHPVEGRASRGKGAER
ncbi:MAG TPA: DUF1525 domain-containing protein [Anaeromyxobacteraceae bacterium]|nr:DUF1525 domain-containing protein [Anaeromyxobacteraceae bacterium]